MLENKNISLVRKKLESSKDALDLPRFNGCTAPMSEKLVVSRDGQILELTGHESRKKRCLVLREDIKYDGTFSLSLKYNDLCANYYGRCDYVVADFE